MRYGVVFPGQGSQFVGMGATLASQSAAVRELFVQADSIVGRSISSICWDGPESVLQKTENAQIGIFLTSIAAFWQLADRGIVPTVIAGHSLGEVTAYCAGGVIDTSTAIRLIGERGTAMANAIPENTSGMAAVLGMPAGDIQAVLALTNSSLVLANDNCPGQVVISGRNSDLDDAIERLKQAGAKRVIRLPVSGAFHSPLMAAAVPVFSAAISKFSLSPPSIPIILNRTAECESDVTKLIDNLPTQLISQVRWTESIQAMCTMVDVIIECGPGKVLTGLIKKINPSIPVYPYDGLPPTPIEAGAQ